MSTTYHLTTLPSGLRIASEFMPGVKSAAIAVTVGVGSRYESDSQQGLSHILEHMAFKGTTTRNAKNIADAFEDIGGQFNAYTTVETTVYYARMLAEHLPKATELLADILQHSIFDVAELAREQQVITQEIAAHKDTPEDYINDLFDAVAYPSQPMGRSILGTEESILSYQRDDVIQYMQSHYTPPRMVISAAGAVDHASFTTMASEAFQHLPQAPSHTPQPAAYQGGKENHHKDLEQTHILYGFPAPHQNHADYYTSQLLASILGGSMSSRLFQEIRENRGLAYHVGSYNVTYSDCGMLMMAAGCAPDKAAELPGLMRAELEKMAQHIEPQELNRAKNQLLTELTMARENSSSIASWIGRHILHYNEYRTLENIIQRVNTLSVEDVMQLAARTLALPPSLVTLGDQA